MEFLWSLFSREASLAFLGWTPLGHSVSSSVTGPTSPAVLLGVLHPYSWGLLVCSWFFPCEVTAWFWPVLIRFLRVDVELLFLPWLFRGVHRGRHPALESSSREGFPSRTQDRWGNASPLWRAWVVCVLQRIGPRQLSRQTYQHAVTRMSPVVSPTSMGPSVVTPLFRDTVKCPLPFIPS